MLGVKWHKMAAVTPQVGAGLFDARTGSVFLFQQLGGGRVWLISLIVSPLSLHMHKSGLKQWNIALFCYCNGYYCTYTRSSMNVHTVLCVPGLLWKDCVMWVHQNGSRETCPARYDFMSYVSLRWGQRSINPVCVYVWECVCVCTKAWVPTLPPCWHLPSTAGR